jgi:hypothetical protein
MTETMEPESNEVDPRMRGAVIAASEVDAWFVREILPLEAALMQFLQHNWRNKSDIADLRQDIYIQVYESALKGLPESPRAFLFTVARHLLWAHAGRSFNGVGPSLSWNASATVLGNKDQGELTFDWGINGALLFGRQKARTDHKTQAYHMPFTPYPIYIGYYYTRIYEHPHHDTRSRKVTIPNLGGFAGLSVKYPNVKFSLGYRADFFFGAVDAGIDARHTKDLGFHGPFATISIGLGG